jgi:hypothetical protein
VSAVDLSDQEMQQKQVELLKQENGNAEVALKT